MSTVVKYTSKSSSEASRGYFYSFPAIRGIQAKREFFVAICPLGLIPKIFLFNEEELPPDLRAQRTLNQARVPEIAQYILSQPTAYTFSSLTASVDGAVEFEPVNDQTPNVGSLIISMATRFLLNDGQHRRAAIEQAINQNPDLANEGISVVFFPDQGLIRSQQMFADLNRYAMKPTKSLGILYDHHDPLSSLARHVADTVAAFKGLVEKEKTTIPNRSTKLITLSSIYEGTCNFLGKKKGDGVTPTEKSLAIDFWTAVSEQIPDWGRAQQRKISTAELRQECVHAHGIMFQALGLMGRTLIQQRPKIWQSTMKSLRDIDWSRANTAVWEGRTMQAGRISRTAVNVTLTANYLKQQLGLDLTTEEQTLEVRSQPHA